VRVTRVGQAPQLRMGRGLKHKARRHVHQKPIAACAHTRARVETPARSTPHSHQVAHSYRARIETTSCSGRFCTTWVGNSLRVSAAEGCHAFTRLPHSISKLWEHRESRNFLEPCPYPLMAWLRSCSLSSASSRFVFEAERHWSSSLWHCDIR
jgi:hypothetical protein